MQTRETGAQVNRLMPGTELVTTTEGAGAEQRDAKDEQSPVDGAAEDSSMAPAENVATVDDDDATEVELVTRLEELLTKDGELSARYALLLRVHRKTRRERRAMRAELRRLHTKEGGILLEIKLYRARKGRGGEWAEFLRQTRPKPLSRTTADRWIQWYLDSKREQSQSEPPSAQALENAPQNESGAFFGGDAESQPASSDPQLSLATDPPSADGSATFEDLQQTSIVLKKSKMAHLKASAEFLVVKKGYETSHEAIYVELTEAAARVGFVYPAAVAGEGETTNVSKGVNPGSETPAAGSKAS